MPLSRNPIQSLSPCSCLFPNKNLLRGVCCSSDFAAFFASDFSFRAVTLIGERERAIPWSLTSVAQPWTSSCLGDPSYITACCPPGTSQPQSPRCWSESPKRGTASSVHQGAIKPQEKQTGRAGGCASEACGHSFAQLEPPVTLEVNKIIGFLKSLPGSLSRRMDPVTSAFSFPIGFKNRVLASRKELSS